MAACGSVGEKRVPARVTPSLVKVMSVCLMESNDWAVASWNAIQHKKNKGRESSDLMLRLLISFPI